MKQHDTELDFTQDWRDEAACADSAEAEAFMQDAWINDKAMMRGVAESICRNCPVRRMCLKDALTDPRSEGLRGGYDFSNGALLGSDRARLRKEFPTLPQGRTRQQSSPLSARQRDWAKLENAADTKAEFEETA